MEYFNCIVCSAGSFSKTENLTRDFKDLIVSCVKCKHLQIFPLPGKKSEKEFYEKDKQSRLILKNINVSDLIKRSRNDTQRRVNKILKNPETEKSILDIGTGYGFFLAALDENGCKAEGIEISSSRLKIAKTITKTKIYKKPIDKANTTSVRYDLITMFHVLEHVANPIDMCRNLKTYLKKSGKLIIEIPNANDHMLKKSTEYKKFYWQRAHVSYFSVKSVKSVLRTAGYSKIKVIGVQRYSFENAINWLKNGKPELSDPTYQTVKELAWLEKTYKHNLEKKLISDTLWIEARA